MRLIGISGSIRHRSHNIAILRTIQDIVPPGVTMELVGLEKIPLYNEDMENFLPGPVRELRAEFAFSDGVIIASPEYNHGMSGLLKNALDWVSRPYGASVLRSKPVLTLTSSPAATGGVRAHGQLNETLLAIGAHLLPYPQIVVGRVDEKVRTGRLRDVETLRFVSAGVEVLLAEARQKAR